MGIEGAHRSELVGESALRHGKRFVQKKIRQHPAKAVQRAESKYIKATADYHFRMAAQEHPEMRATPCPGCPQADDSSGNSQSRHGRPPSKERKAAEKTAVTTEKLAARTVGFVKRHPVGVLLAVAVSPAAGDDAVLYVLAGDAGQRHGGGDRGDHLPAEDEDMLGAEAAYSGYGGGAAKLSGHLREHPRL